jgi:hypothetical protein
MKSLYRDCSTILFTSIAESAQKIATTAKACGMMIATVLRKTFTKVRSQEEVMTELTLYTPEMPWEELAFFPGNAEVKVLRSEAEGGARTLLVRMPPGGEIEPHSHLGVVQHYVLDGEYDTLGETFGAGTYRMLPKHANLGSITTQGGATILMIYDPVDDRARAR